MHVLILVGVFTPYYEFKQILFFRVNMLGLEYEFTPRLPSENHGWIGYGAGGRGSERAPVQTNINIFCIFDTSL